jgi:alpha-tubulin suppressor-like RCC1 family protein
MRARTSPFVSIVAFAVLGCVERVEVLSPAPDGGGTAIAVSDIALGEEHGCAIATSRLYCWGNNEYGQLGLGDATLRDRPTLVAGSWRAVAAGTRHTCALDELGRVACFGQNDRGQLGTGDREARSEPTFVELPSRATLVTTDFTHTCALLSDATLHCWGKNDEGELGQDDAYPGDQSLDADALSPVAVPGSWRAVETGQGHTCAIRLEGTLFCWGRNTEHELGESDQIQVRFPIQVGTDADWLSVDAGQSHTCGLRQDFFGYCWGRNTGFETSEGAPLGIPGATEITSPTRLETTGDFTLLRTDTFHTCAVNHDAELFCWGRGVEGQLGLGDQAFHDVPTFVGSGYAAVAVGRFATCAIAEGGGLLCTGKNDQGQLGTGDTAERAVFTPIEVGAP